MLAALLRVMAGASSRSGNSLAEKVALIGVVSSVAGAAKHRVEMGGSERVEGRSRVRRPAERAAEIMVVVVGDGVSVILFISHWFSSRMV